MVAAELGRLLEGPAVQGIAVARIRDPVAVGVGPQVDRREGVHDPPAEHVVRPACRRSAAAGRRRSGPGARRLLKVASADPDQPLQGRLRGPEQRHDAGHVRARHRGAARGAVACPRGGRADRDPGRCDVRLEAVAPVDRDRSAAAEAGEGAGAVDRARREDRVVDRRGVLHGGAGRARVPGGDDRHLPRGAQVSNPLWSVRASHPSLGGQVQELFVMSAPSSGRPSTMGSEPSPQGAAPLHALEVEGRRAVAVVHVPAADPPRPRGHPDLIARAVVAHHRADRVGPVALVVERDRRVLHGVVP